jgi:hypothetical protein
MYGLFYIIFWIVAPQAARNDEKEDLNDEKYGLFCYCIFRNRWIASLRFALLAMAEQCYFCLHGLNFTQ